MAAQGHMRWLVLTTGSVRTISPLCASLSRHASAMSTSSEVEERKQVPYLACLMFEIETKEGISSPIAAQIVDFGDDGLGDNLLAVVTSTSDPFAPSSEDVSSSSTATPPLCSYSDDIPEMAFSLLPCFDSTLLALLEEHQNVCPYTNLIPPINDTLAEPGYYQAANGEVSIEQFGQPRLPQSIDEPLLAMQMSSTSPISMPLAPGCDEECLTAALTRGYMSLDSALYPQTGAMILSYNTVASKLGFFNGSGGNSNGMVVLDMSDIGEYQRMIEGEGLTRTYSDTDSMQGGYSNTAEIQVTSGT
ncbi:uncharacterized protein LOC123426611 [Hordeum vulgare subsp. vulgare]|uniref:uncharacterized protein LOC123426611 n=1 Tax=Hordeum vulgare subsp. vulgare TaxID=112509 RepID=UPI001D1A4EC7|nr:uncharacterized protein LOC123426611 [Hordeum vulgare subsp. vulgare]